MGFVDSEIVWKLIISLPFNEKRVRELRELRDDIEWKHFFNPHVSPYQLLYTLQILDHLTTPSSSSSSSSSSHAPSSQELVTEKNQWSKFFFYKGGFTQLYCLLPKLIDNVNDYLQHPAGKQILALLLRLLVYFMKGSNQSTLLHLFTFSLFLFSR
jgi:hypothetical protein